MMLLTVYYCRSFIACDNMIEDILSVALAIQSALLIPMLWKGPLRNLESDRYKHIKLLLACTHCVARENAFRSTTIRTNPIFAMPSAWCQAVCLLRCLL